MTAVASPVRIRRQRTKGWRMPENTVYVGRPTVWGNPWRPEDAAAYFPHVGRDKRERAAWAVGNYRQDLTNRQIIHYDLCDADAIPLADVPALLGGRDLACWCPLDQPCHADVLLALANPTTDAA